eukprot:5971103-Karenia_brevis.AAC.1
MDHLRKSDAFRLTHPKSKPDVVCFKPPYMLAHGTGVGLKMKANRSFYSYHFRKAAPVVQGFLHLITRMCFAPAPPGQPGHT